MQRLVHFLSYNNAVPIAVSFMLLGAGGAFAAANPEAIYSSEETVLSIDNTYIAGKDLTAWSPRVEITSVTEDTEQYYVAYNFTTIALVDAVWKDVTEARVLPVAKGVLGNTLDLGLYATRQLNEVIDAEISRLRETQEYERKVVSNKTVATAYGGLVGRLLDDRTEVLPGYVPVVTPPAPIVEETPAGQVAGASTQEPNTSQTTATPEPASSGGDGTIPKLQVLGANPARLEIGSSYVDLGVLVTDLPENDIPVRAFINDSDYEFRVGELIIDTAKDAEWKITYVATDASGNKGTAARTIIVGKGNIPPPETTATSTEEVGSEPQPTTSEEGKSPEHTASTTTESSPDAPVEEDESGE